MGRMAPRRRARDSASPRRSWKTPTLRTTLGDMHIPGIFAAEEVVRTTLERLSEGCSYVYAFGEPAEESERQTQARRQRVLAVEQISRQLFAAER